MERTMRTLFRLFIVLPIALIVILFAVANRAFVNVSFNPFSDNDIAGLIFPAPLFLVMFICAIIGVLLGGTAVWFAQGRNRREAREARAEARRAMDEAAGLRAQIFSQTNAIASSNVAQPQSPNFLPTIRHDAA